MSSLLLPHLSSSLIDSLSSLNLLCHSKTDAQFMQDGRKAVWSIPYVSVAFFPSLKQNFIAYCCSKVSLCPDCIFEIHQLWQSGFSRVNSNSCYSCWFEAEIIKIGQSSHKMNSNNSEFSRVYDNFKCLYKECLETYWMHHVCQKLTVSHCKPSFEQVFNTCNIQDVLNSNSLEDQQQETLIPFHYYLILYLNYIVILFCVL